MKYVLYLYKNKLFFDCIRLELLDKGDRRLCIKILQGPLEGEIFEDWDYFTALTKLRYLLEKKGLLIGCNGALEYFYPSNMSLDMGLGKIGYMTVMGQPSTREAVASVFEQTDCIEGLSTVDEQIKFHKRWKKSIA